MHTKRNGLIVHHKKPKKPALRTRAQDTQSGVTDTFLNCTMSAQSIANALDMLGSSRADRDYKYMALSDLHSELCAFLARNTHANTTDRFLGQNFAGILNIASVWSVGIPKPVSPIHVTSINP